ncbi:MAG: hypothetical protein KJ623_00830 [Nanoarchaeota archaeon]|nr:hypothetical protein [Nanoarchaeota archaeon]MBU0963055.1 hypothetical protein [Nanoarchaeota archaeon]
MPKKSKKKIIKKIIKKVDKKVVKKTAKVTKKQVKISKIIISRKELDDLMTHLINKEAVDVIMQLQKRKNVSEFSLAEKLKMSINQFRNIIYRLDAFNLVSSSRKKDKQKGWYVYYWTFYPERLEQLYLQLKRKKLERLKKKLELEQKTDFYICPNKCIRVPLAEAMELSFRCPECGKLLQEDKLNAIKKTLKEIEDIENELKQANNPL